MSVGIGLIVGLVLGLTGAGGSIFAVPLLMAGLGYSITQAATVSLLAVAISAGVGTAMAWKHSYVRYRAASLMAAIGALFAPLGIGVADRMSQTSLALIFALVLAAVAARMFYTATVSKDDATVVRSAVAGEGRSSIGRVGRVHATTGRLIWTRPVAITVSLIGAVTGFLSGLLGVGGGFIIVPAIRATLPLSIHSAVATSLMAIALTSSLTFVGGILQGRPAPLATALPFVAGAVLGMILGRRVAPLISGPSLQQGFGITAGIIAVVMALKSWSAL
ncbi:sulfite exporter TauE/SafE family protein [Aromatoleum toluclasticum]|uniref:sulfite exporter TauE/SafE family protein n=1 Tax=Aromatoleum toluclasticum TaxID=92003 RepID=UPI001D181C06|nr:sulfite exporter TauE/SafE family protein [Aromatoleum toluclasticum]MCC4118694.1 sulfite exporter TauE/SafE family protein [Aromatoleum toluclasticum]